jgi:hypothetical protein
MISIANAATEARTKYTRVAWSSLLGLVPRVIQDGGHALQKNQTVYVTSSRPSFVGI